MPPLPFSKNARFSNAFGKRSNDLEKFSHEDRTGTDQFVPSNKDVHVSNCLFHDCTSDSCGGAVSCSTSIERIFIEETTFATCKTTNSYGGGIYFCNTNSGQCVIFRTCSFNCSSIYSDDISFGQYAAIETNNDASSKNVVNESTITGTKNEYIYSSEALNLQNGNIICSLVNITNNECYSYPAFCCCPTKTSAYACCVIYASIVNNGAKSGHGCLEFDNPDATQLISMSNIVNNTQDDEASEAIIFSYANLFINESCIIGNKAGKIFMEDCSSPNEIKITNCTLDSNIKTNTKYEGSVRFLSSKEYDFINALSHIVTGKCEGLLDIYGLRVEARQVKGAKNVKKGNTCYNKRRNGMFLNFLQYLCMITLLPSLSTRCISYVDIGIN